MATRRSNDDDETPTLPPAEARTVEDWAERKGLLPVFIETREPFSRPESPPTRGHNPDNWKFAAARAGNAWPEGKQMTEAEFDAAVTEATTTHSFR